MQFELTTCTHDAATLTAALRPLDRDARGHLDVIATAITEQVQRALEQIGCAATLSQDEVHISDGSTCCGGCS